MYGYAHEKSLNTVRSLMLKKMVGEDARLTRLTVQASPLQGQPGASYTDGKPPPCLPSNLLDT